MPASVLHAACLLFTQLPLGPSLMAPPERAVLQPVPVQEQSAIRIGTPTPASHAAAPPASLTPPESLGAAAGDGGSLRDRSRPGRSAQVAPVEDATAVATDGATAAVLIKTALATPEPQTLAGESLSLLAALERVETSDQKLAVVKSYWRLSTTVASYYFASEESRFLSDITPSGAPHDEAVLAARRAAAEAAQVSALLAVLRAQHGLAETALTPTGELPPLPADCPFVGRYDTHFQAVAASQTASSSLLRIDRTLPHVRRWIESLAAAAATAQTARDVLRQAYQHRQASLAELLAAHHDLSDQRRSFLTSVLDYNEQIAEYALSVAGPRVDPATVVSMLIEARLAERSVLVSSRGVQPTGGEQPLQPVPPITPAGGSLSPFREVAP